MSEILIPAKGKSKGHPFLSYRHLRSRGRLFCYATCLGLVLLAFNMLSNAPIARASSLTHHGGTPLAPQTPQVSGPRVSPDLNPQPLSVGAWQAPQNANTSSALNPSSPHSPQGRKPGEQPDLRTATSDTILNPDGTWTLKSYGAPINYKDSQGKWQPIDSGLVSDTSVAGYTYGNKANDWRVHFAAQAGGPNLVHAQLPTVTMQESLQGAAKVPGHVSGSQMEYAGVFPGTDLLYTVSSSNLEELLLLQNAQGPSSYTFVYHLPGASAKQDTNGNMIFTDVQGKVLLVIGGLFMYESDAHGQMLPQAAGTQNVQMSLSQQGNDFLVTLTPDQTWLKDPKRHFPVAIDPSQTWQGGDGGANTTDGNIYADTIDESSNPTVDYWSMNNLRIGNCGNLGNGTTRSYLKFPVGGAPAGARVTSANLAIYQSSMYSGGLGVQINANLITSPWSVTNVTWNNHPTGFIYAGSGTTANSQLNWVNINVTNAAAEWWQGGVALNGIELQLANESQQCQLYFSDNNSDNSHHPSLTINYVQDTTPPTGSVLFNGQSTMGTAALLYSGNDTSTNESFAYMKVFDLSSQNVTIGPNTTLSYWIFPQSGATFGGVSGSNSTCVAVDAVFTDGSDIRDSGSVDQHGNSLHPTAQCGHLQLDQWNLVTSTLGVKLNGKTFQTLMVAYDQAGHTGGYRGFVDDLSISNPGSSTPLFATGFESGNPQPTWTNTAVSNQNIGGICCNLTGPEMFVGAGIGHSSGTSSPFTNTPTVNVQPYALDPGSLNEWNSNWSSVNGISSNTASHGEKPASTSVSGGTELDANTSSCGGSACWVQTFFGHTINGNNWPTFTAQFKTANTNNFELGIQDSGNSWTRCMLHGGTGGFVSTSYSASPGSLSSGGFNMAISPNTWYFGQFALTNSNECAITIWPVGQPRPNTPSVVQLVSSIPNAGLVFQVNGDNGPNLNSYSVGPVTMTSLDMTNPNNSGTGVAMISLSSDGNTWGCPPTNGSSSFSGGPWCVYSSQSFPWTFSGSDGKKTLWYQYTDNVGQTVSGSSSIIYDTTPPVVNSISPGNDSEVRGIVTVQVNASDPTASDGSNSGVASAVLYVDGVQAGSPISGTSAPTFLWDTTNLSQGVHTLTAKATDAAGNTGVIGGSTTVIVSNTSGSPSAIVGGVNVANGDAIVSHTDLAIPGRGPNLTITRTYHALGNQIGFFGHNWSSNLDESLSFPGGGNVIYIDPSGGYHVFLPNGSGGYLTSPGLYLTLVKNGDGTYTITAHDQSKTNFSSTGQLGSIVDRHGNTLTINYGSNGFPSMVTDAAGRQLTITSSNGDITQITDPSGRTVKYAYNSGYLQDYTDPTGIITNYNYTNNPTGLLNNIVENYTSAYPSGDAQTNVSTKLTYDSENRLVKLVDPMGYDTDLSYSTVGAQSQTVVQRLQGISPATYISATFLMTTDGMGNVARLTDALNNASTFQYDANDNITQATDPDGHVVTHTYDANGNALTSVVDPGSSPHLNLTTSSTYDAANNVLTTTNPLGIVTQYIYDSPIAGDPIKVVADYVANGPTTSDTNVTTTSTYDSYGEVVTTTDALGVVTKMSYDSQGDVTSTIANYTTSGTQYERPITLNNSANANTLSNYQISFPLDTASLIAAGKMRSDCGDVRIYDSDDATAINNYWVENCNSSATLVWVKVPSIPASAPKTIYLHYGNSTQTSLSSISNTFVRDVPNTLADWPMHESSGSTVADATGDGYAGTATSTTSIVAGKFGNARSFNGTAGYVQIANESSLPFGTSARTVCAWVSTNSLSGLSVIFDTGTPNTDQYFGIGRNGSSLAGFGWNDDLTVPNFFTVGTWNQVCLTYDGTTATLYGNGVQLAQATKAWNTVDSGGTYIGNDKPNHVWNGTIEEVSYYGRALSGAEISDLAHNYGYATSNDKGHVLVRSYSSPEPVTSTGNENTLSSSASVTTSATYDVLGERLTATNPLGIVTQYSYDNLGHVVQTVANYQSGKPSDAQTNVTTKAGYDALGRSVTATDALGVVNETVYDADGRVSKTVLDYVANGPSDTQTNVVNSTQSYDAMGDVLTATDAKGNVTTATYDLDGRALKTTQKDSNGTVLQNGQVVYDPAGLVTERDILDGSGNMLLKLTYGFDGAGRATTTTIPAAIPGFQGQAGTPTVSTITYDAGGEQLEAKITNAGLPSPSVVNDATATYDHLGHVLTKTEESGTSSAQTTSFVYDPDGRQTSTTDPAGHVTSTSYDALGRVLTTTQPDGVVNTMTYDTAGELLSTANSAGTTKDTYDVLGRVTYEERDDGTGVLQTGVTYIYDANGNKLTQKTNYPGGTTTSYTWTYDKLNRAATMSDGTRTYTYDLNSNVTQMTVAVNSNTITQDSYSYDGANRLTGLTTKMTTSNTTLHSYGYTYDALGNQMQISQDGTTTTYSYDNLYQLLKVAQGSTTIASYSYDANSNRTSMVTSAGTTNYTYDSSDTQMTSKIDPNGKVTNYTYDPKNGNLTQSVYDPSGSNQKTGYLYDAENRLTEVDEPSGMKVQFAYDADGNRISKIVTNGSTVTTVKDIYAVGHLWEQTDGSGNVLASFTYESSGRPGSVVLGNPSTGNRYYYIYNGHGDVVALTDASGNVVASYTYDAFGSITSSSENFPGGWSNPYRYDGADGVIYDGETGLYWMSVRAYDPTLGRFLQHDPLGRLAAEGIDFHPYVYTDNNPINRTDPSGQRWIDDNGDTGWISNGAVYVQTPGSKPQVVAHVKVPVYTPPPTGGCGGGGGVHGMSAANCAGASTQPTSPPGCDGLTPKECENGMKSMQEDIAGLKNQQQWLKVAVSGATFLADFFTLVKDILKASSVLKILEVIGDVLSVIGDGLTVLSQMATIFHWTGAQRAIDGLGAIFNALGAVYRGIRAALATPWGAIVAGALVVGFYALRMTLFGGPGLSALVAPILGALADHVMEGKDNPWKYGALAASSAVQAWWNADQYQIDTLSTESTTTYCHSNPAKC